MDWDISLNILNVPQKEGPDWNDMELSKWMMTELKQNLGDLSFWRDTKKEQLKVSEMMSKWLKCYIQVFLRHTYSLFKFCVTKRLFLILNSLNGFVNCPNSVTAPSTFFPNLLTQSCCMVWKKTLNIVHKSYVPLACIVYHFVSFFLRSTL